MGEVLGGLAIAIWILFCCWLVLKFVGYMDDRAKRRHFAETAPSAYANNPGVPGCPQCVATSQSTAVQGVVIDPPEPDPFAEALAQKERDYNLKMAEAAIILRNTAKLGKLTTREFRKLSRDVDKIIVQSQKGGDLESKYTGRFGDHLVKMLAQRMSNNLGPGDSRILLELADKLEEPVPPQIEAPQAKPAPQPAPTQKKRRSGVTLGG